MAQQTLNAVPATDQLHECIETRLLKLQLDLALAHDTIPSGIA